MKKGWKGSFEASILSSVGRKRCLKMLREELSAREEFTYNHVSSLERASGTAGRRGDRRSDRGERDSFTVDVRASDLQLARPEPPKHPCFSYRAWLYSVLIGVRHEGGGHWGVKATNYKVYNFRDTFSDECVPNSKHFEPNVDEEACFCSNVKRSQTLSRCVYCLLWK